MSFKGKLEKLSKYGIAITFLALEVFAFISFSFGSSYLLFAILSTVLAILLIVFYFQDIKRGDYATTLFFIFPLLIFAILAALNIPDTATYMYGHRIIDGDFTIAEMAFVPIGLAAIAFCGYALGVDKDFKIKYMLIVLYASLSILVIINLIANLIHFGPFYNLIYKNYYMYYGGLKSSRPIQDMAYTLEGFTLIESDIRHYLLYPILLLSSNFMLFYCSPKSEKKQFFTYLTFTSIALLALIFVPNIVGLLFVIGCALLDGVMLLYSRVEKSRKIIKYAIYVALFGVGLVILIIIIVNQDIFEGLRNALINSGFLGRLFVTNGYVTRFAKVVKNVLGSNFIGKYYYIENEKIAYGAVTAPQSGSFVFDSFMFAGFIGAAALFIFLFFGFKSFKKYFANDNDEYKYKTLVLSFLVVYFVYSLAFNEGEYGIYYKINKPFYITGPFMISVFLLVYVFTKSLSIKKEKATEESEVKDEE